MRSPYPDTYYARTRTTGDGWPAICGTVNTDILVIGGGLAGLTLARNLAATGRDVTLIEAKAIAFGASGRNGGFVSAGYACGQAAIAQRVGDQAADALFQLSIDAVDEIRERIASYGPDTQITPQDGIISAGRLANNTDLLRTQDWLSGFGYDTEYLDYDAIQALAPSPKYFNGLLSKRAFHIHPLNYMRALAGEATALGAKIHEDSPAQTLDRVHGGYVVTTQNGAHIKAQQVAVTTGGYTGRLLPALHAAYVPVATYVMASKPAPEALSNAIKTPYAIGDSRRAGNYYRLVENGARLLWGGAITVRDRDPDQIVTYLRRELAATHPQIADLRMEVSWSGWMSYARHKMPQIGQHMPGLWYATAFGGHGLNTTAVAARVIAEAITGVSDRWRQFEPWGLSWAGGPAGRVAAQTTYHWLQWQDRRQEARSNA